ncbi:MAG: hypothetical protein HC936_00940 [Leptolyngbyaceae cyanobacterium SU_3_3]|nr:hypothetical protein [Leptolyngbyaceae cyanobacterium SU_3_3]NJR50924.1 hypothetical protein [Leptolyngbyaceae cyanobacterium CSU_1_3]
MSKSELQEAIECPAKRKATFEPGLVEQILEDLGSVSGNLPLLEFALDELWKQGRLTLDAYREIGGVREALAKRADRIYEEYEIKDKGKQVEKLFRQLVAVGEDTADTRRIVTQSQVTDWNLIEELAAKRLLVIGQDEKNQERTVELIHEALIQEWKRLREWVNDKREDGIKFQRIESAAKEWEKNKNAMSDLWQGRRLKDAVQLLQKQDEIEPISSLTKEFIKKSETARNSKLIRNFLIGFASVSFMVCITGYLFIQENNRIVQDNNRKLKLAALRGETSLEILKAVPGWLREAEDRQREGKDVQAIVIARDNARIMENWRNAIVANSGKYNQSSIREFSKQAVDRQVSVIQQFSLPRLKKELTKKPNAMIGKEQSTDPSKNCDQRYTEGALRTTCNIIFQDLGAATDLWSNSQENAGVIPNRITTQEQSDRIPCPIVVLIEELWRNNTKKNCGWLGSQGKGLDEPSCKELGGKSLADRIFPDPIYAPMKRLRKCPIPHSNNIKQSQTSSKIATLLVHK